MTEDFSIVYVCVYIYICMYTYTHTYIHTHIYFLFLWNQWTPFQELLSSTCQYLGGSALHRQLQFWEHFNILWIYVQYDWMCALLPVCVGQGKPRTQADRSSEELVITESASFTRPIHISSHLMEGVT